MCLDLETNVLCVGQSAEGEQSAGGGVKAMAEWPPGQVGTGGGHLPAGAAISPRLLGHRSEVKFKRTACTNIYVCVCVHFMVYYDTA